MLIQLIVVLKNDMTASYLTEADAYWTLFYYKPYTRIQGFLIGVILGCQFFTHKQQERALKENSEVPSSSNDDQLSFSSSSDSAPFNSN